MSTAPRAESSPARTLSSFPPIRVWNGRSTWSFWPTWRDAAELRREINRLVSRVSAKTSTPHSVVHTQLRQSVPGPPSASASVDVLRARRERLRTML